MRNILVFIICLTLFFVLCIASDITPFLRGPAPYPPDWQWDYLFVNTYRNIWLPVVISAIILLVFYKLEVEKESWINKNKLLILSTIIILGFLFQISVLYFNRAGVEVLLHRIINPGLNGYFTSSLEIENVPKFFENFNDTVLTLHQHAEGHPPFSVLFFYVINKAFLLAPFLFDIAEKISPSTNDVKAVWDLLLPNEKLGALFSTLFIPFLSSLVTLPLYAIAKKLYGIRSAIRAIILYVFIPGIVLFIPINDVFISIFPLISFLFFVIALDKKSVIYASLSGIIFSVGLLFSLSLLPLLVVFASYGFNFLKQSKTQLVFGFSIIIIPILLFYLFKFNSILVFKTIMSGLPESRNYFPWVVYNLYDFFIFLGLGISVIYFFSLYKSFKFFIGKSFKTIDPILIGTFIMLVLLNFSGSVRGEVGRIWIPFMPFLILPVANLLTSKTGFAFSTKDFVIFLATQIVLILVINEYWVTLW